MSITLYPSPQTRRTVEHAVAGNKVILWINGPKTLYFNSGITVGSSVGVVPSPTDGGVGFGADLIVNGGTDGFASAARAAGRYTGSGLSSEFEDDAAAQAVWSGVTVQRAPVVTG